MSLFSIECCIKINEIYYENVGSVKTTYRKILHISGRCNWPSETAI